MKKSKVLLYIDHAPDYREAFLQELSNSFDLFVVAHPCENDGLKPPLVRGTYKYRELTKTIGSSIRVNFEFSNIIKQVEPDVICVALNPRYPIRLLDFICNHKLSKKWIWWGQIYGRNESGFLEKLKKYFIKKSAGTLVYTDDIVERLNMPNVISFDNSQFSQENFVKLENKFEKSTLKCLFVGRPQIRKRLELLFKFANERKDILFRLVGPGMEDYFKKHPIPSNIELYPAATGNTLRQHFKWCNLVINPGHVGLLVMNAACHNRAIVIDSKVSHAPEVILAKEANQYFIDFMNEREVNDFFDKMIMSPDNMISKGEELYNYSINKYTVEEMTNKHEVMFNKIISKNK